MVKLKLASFFIAFTAVFMFFFWWGSVDFLQRDFQTAYIAFCCTVFGGLLTWGVEEFF